MASDVSRKAPPGSLLKVRAVTPEKKPVAIKQVGKRGRAWLRFRRQWIRDNPPDYLGNYVCTLCGCWVPQSVMQLDHIKKRGANPDKVLDVNNVRPVCRGCNLKREM